MKCLIFPHKGSVEVSQVDRRELAHHFDLHLRDLRPVFSSRQLMSISPKGKGIILNLGILKMVIGAEEVFIFNADHPEVAETFTRKLSQAISDNEEKVRFQFLVLETALAQRFEKFRKHYEKLEFATESLMNTIKTHFGEEQIEAMLGLKKKLSRFETNIKELNDMLLEILNDDHELIEFYLEASHDEQDTEDIESVLEFFSEPAEEIVHKIEDLKEHIDDTQESVHLKLSNRRNTIIRFDLVATLITTILSTLAVVSGIYGMNIRNNLEHSFQGFIIIVGFMVAFAIGTFLSMWWYMRNRNIF